MAVNVVVVSNIMFCLGFSLGKANGRSNGVGRSAFF